jgi:hypothetical protein
MDDTLRAEIRRLIDLGWTNDVIAYSLKCPIRDVGRARARYRTYKPEVLTDSEVRANARIARKRFERAAQRSAALGKEPSLPTVSILDRDLGLTDADYYAGREAMREAGL